jgi:nicotinate-nucleotide adenylyltransferase
VKIGLYFGSFNPVHTGHLIIASYFAQNTDLDQVWFVVSPQNPLKSENGLLNENHRKYLIDLAIEGEFRLRSSNVEFKLPRPSYTIDTMTYIQEFYPQHQFSILMGSDSYSNIHRWKNYEVLLKNYPIYLYPRTGFEVKVHPGSRIREVEAPLLEISSTLIRSLIQQGKSIRYLVPDLVKDEIERQNYYRDRIK